MKPFATILLVAALSGCSTLQDDVRNDRERAIAGCIRQVEISGPRFKAHAMAYMGVSRENLATTMCNRLADAVAQGRIDQSDINRLISTGQLTSKFGFLRG